MSAPPVGVFLHAAIFYDPTRIASPIICFYMEYFVFVSCSLFQHVKMILIWKVPQTMLLCLGAAHPQT